VRTAAKGFDAVAWLEVGGRAEGFDDRGHGFAVEDTSDVVGDGGSGFAPTSRWKFLKEDDSYFSSNGTESVAVEKLKRGSAVKCAEQVKSFCEGYGVETGFSQSSRHAE
jgi:hypothetical protein